MDAAGRPPRIRFRHGLIFAQALLYHSLKKPFLAFLATGPHGATELRFSPDGRLYGRATIAEATARG